MQMPLPIGIHQHLQLETQVVYLEGLNGSMVPVVTSLPELLTHGTNALNNEPTFLQVDLSQFTAEDHESKAQLLVELQHPPPPCISPWHIFPKQRATLA